MNKTIGDRMKEYENCYRIYLPKRSAVVIRIDGRHFHSFTKNFKRPYDEVFAHAMWETAEKLCQEISGCKFAYTQSDEITLILTDYENINTEPWFGNNLQKLVSISASVATFYFSKAFSKAIKDEYNDVIESERTNLLMTYSDAYNNKLAVFDSRAFIIPREEIFNVLYWRQLDCKRNSIQLLGQSYFSHKNLQYKNSDQIQEMLWQEKNINWSKEPEWFKNGVCIYKIPTIINSSNSDLPTVRYKWKIDTETPVFTKDPNYINKHFNLNKE